jgi:V/A-type H+-transporting ATPase subunit E
MPEELQHLLTRIQEDGVAKANARAEEIIADANATAKTIVDEAKKNAAEHRKKAEEDAQAFEQRAKKTLEQASRDIILSVGEAVTATMRDIVAKKTSDALDTEGLKAMLAEVVKVYFAQDSETSRIDILVNPEQQQAIKDMVTTAFADAASKGLEVKADDTVISGFTVSVVDSDVQHDFTQEAITEALTQLLRPYLAEIVNSAAGTSAGNKG